MSEGRRAHPGEGHGAYTTQSSQPHSAGTDPDAYGGPSTGNGNDDRLRLAQGLMRFGQEGEAAPSVVAKMPLPHLPRAASEPAGMALGRLITTMSARNTVWSADQLYQSAHRLRASRTAPAADGFFYTDTAAMNTISHAIEERVIADSLDCELYAGFQRLSLLQPQLRRYRALAHCARHVFAYGLDDLRPGSEAAAFQHPRFLRFAIDPRRQTGLEWFWFVVVNHAHLRTALLAQHVAGDIWGSAQATRSYSGFWTFDPKLVDDVVSLLRQAAVSLYYDV